jgi:ATP-dependent Lhr-like helicase
MGESVLDRFSPATADWFRGSFLAPTPAQEGAWDAISSGRHAVVVAPTGSGKTLAAFLWALDRLSVAPVPEDRARRCRVLYISPLKALAVDVERNLRSPLVGIGHAAARLGMPLPQVRVAVRSGDTPAADRRGFVRDPSDILITTPESLFLMLTSAARESLVGVETVILDEVHAVAGTKRGAHLALTLERLDALLERPAQRIGLSATVRPSRRSHVSSPGVGRSTSWRRPPPSSGTCRSSCQCPISGAIGSPTGDLSGPAAGEPGAGVDLAARRGAHRRPRCRPPLDAGLRQLATAGRAADDAAQRDLAGAHRRSSRSGDPLLGAGGDRIGTGYGWDGGTRHTGWWVGATGSPVGCRRR